MFAFTQPPPLWRHLLVTVVIVMASVVISMATDCLGIVLELNVSRVRVAQPKFAVTAGTLCTAFEARIVPMPMSKRAHK